MRATFFVTLLAAVAVAGCGSTGATGNASHATAVPSATPAQVASEAPVPVSSTPPSSIPASSTPARTAAPPVSTPPAPKPPPPVSTKPVPKPPPPSAPAPAPKASCYPLTNGGNCYEPGEFCRDSDHGDMGLAGDGEVIKCEDNDGWRWEPV